MAYETLVARRHLQSRKHQSVSVITVICTTGVVIGVAALVTVLSVTGGFQEAFRNKVLGFNAHILVMKYGLDFTEYRDVMARAEALPGVLGSSPFIFHEMMLSAGPELSGVMVKGIDPETAGRVSDVRAFLTQGRLEDVVPSVEGRPPTVLLGAELVERFGLTVGDPVTLVSPLRGLDPGTWGPRDTRPTSQVFQLAGVFSSGFFEYDSRFVYVHLRSLQRFFGQADSVTGVELKVEDIFATPEVSRRVRRSLGDQRYSVRDWTQDRAPLLSRLEETTRRSFAGFLLLFAVLLAMGSALGHRLRGSRSARIAVWTSVLALCGLAAMVGRTSRWGEAWLEIPELEGLPHVTLSRDDAPFLEYRNAVQEAEFLPGVLSAGPVVEGGVRLRPAGSPSAEGTPLRLRGFSISAGVTSYRPWIVEGSTEGMAVLPRLDPDAPSPGLLVGTGLARSLGLVVGDEVTLTAEREPSAAPPPDLPPPLPMRFRVSGLLSEAPGVELAHTLLGDFTACRRLLSSLDAANAVEVRVARPVDAPVVARLLRTSLGGHSYRTLDWREINRNLFSSLELQKRVLSLIVFAMVVVAMFNIVSTLFIIVADKTREIAILKSMGATNGGIMRIFVLEGLVIGAVGTLLGLLLGAAACWVISRIDFPLDPKIYLIQTLPARPRPLDFAVTGVVALATSLLATLHPSLKAARLPPVDGLRFD